MRNDLTATEAIQVVREAWYRGSQIIPIIGAGFSVDAGVPALASIIRYLALLNIHVREKQFAPKSLQSVGTPASWIEHLYSNGTSRFVEDFGWPDPYDLEFSVAFHSETRRLDELIEESRRSLIKAIYSGEQDAARELVSIIDSEAVSSAIAWESTSLLLDWRKLVRVFTGYKKELTDSLFSAIHSNRKPSYGHRYLAHLVQLFSTGTVFTFNFDPLIEHAFADAGIEHQVFAMEEGKSLPSRVLVRDVAVIKMHGGTHNLLIDERLDYPLSSEYRDRFLDLVGSNPLLVVLGCSGNDRRLRDLVDSVLHQQAGSKSFSVLWCEYCQNKTSKLVRAPKSRDGLAYLRIRDAGQFLSHLFTGITQRLPSSATPYICHATRRYPSVSHPTASCLPRMDEDHRKSVTVISSIERSENGSDRFVSRESVFTYLHSSIENSRPYLQQIYVDLECCYSISGIVAEIVEQARRYDPTHTPFLVGYAEDDALGPAPREEFLRLCARKVLQILMRSQVCLVIDGLNAYPWRPTNHHGIVRSSREIEHVKQLFGFLGILVPLFLQVKSKNGSRIIIATDNVAPRRNTHFSADEASSFNLLQDLFVSGVDALLAMNVDTHITKRIEPRLSVPAFENILSQSLGDLELSSSSNTDLLAFAMLAACRRPRSESFTRAALESVCGEMIGEPYIVDKLLDRLIEMGVLSRLEGGFLAMDRELQNEMYKAASEHVSSRSLILLLKNLADKDSKEPIEHQLVQTTSQLLGLCRIHSTLANLYYDESFAPSRDAYQLMESIYHALSAFRHITSLAMLAETVLGGQYETATRRAINRVFSPAASSDGIPAGPAHGVNKELLRLIAFSRPDDGPVYARFRSSEDIVKTLHNIRDSLARRISRNWERHQGLLRRSVVADKLISFCDAVQGDLQSHESPRVRYESIINRTEYDHQVQSSLNNLSVQTSTDKPSIVQSLRRSVWRTCIKSLFNKGDHASVAKRCQDEIIGLAGDWTSISPAENLSVFSVELFNVLRAYACDAEKIQLPEGANKEDLDYAFELYVSGVSATYRVSVEDGETDTHEQRDPFLGIPLSLMDGMSFRKIPKNKIREKFENSPNHLLGFFLLGHEMKNIIGGSSSRGESAQLEAYLRIFHLLNDALLNEVDNVGGFARSQPGDKNRSLHQVLDDICDDTEDLIFLLRNARSVHRPKVENMIIDETEGNGLLMPYRSLFSLLAGRAYAQKALLCSVQQILGSYSSMELEGEARWGWLFRMNGKVRLQDKQSGSIEHSTRLFRNAFKHFGAARNGLSRDDSILMVFCELFSARAALMSTDGYSFSAFQSIQDPAMLSTVTGRIQAKLSSAKGYLDSAKLLIAEGSKNSLALVLYSYLASRFSCQRLAYSCFMRVVHPIENLDDNGMVRLIRDAWRDYAETQELVRYGIRGIREGLEHVGPRAGRYRSELYRCWLELLFSSFMALFILGMRYRQLTANISGAKLQKLLMSIPRSTPAGFPYETGDSNGRATTHADLINLFEDFWREQNELEFFETSRLAPQWTNILEKALDAADFQNLSLAPDSNILTFGSEYLKSFYSASTMEHWWSIGKDRWRH